METWCNELDGFEPRPVGPMFCPRCGRTSAPTPVAGPCPDCGAGLQTQGFCGVCERFWPRAVGTLCPKHEISLEAQPHAWPLPLEHEPGAGPAWVTVGVFADALKAQAHRIRLEAEGIPTFLEGERMGSRSMYAVATGGVRLQVPRALEADARVLLAQVWTSPALDDDLDDAWEDLAPDVWGTLRDIMRVLIILVLVAPFLYSLFSRIIGH